MYKYETHLHTYPVSKCARKTVAETLDFYKEKGYDGVFLTNHFVCGNINIDSEAEQLSAGDLVLFRSRGAHSMRTKDLSLNRYYTLKILPKLIYNISPKNSREKTALRFSIFNSDLKHIWRANELEGTDIQKGYRELM